MIDFPFSEVSIQKIFGQEIRLARQVLGGNEFLLTDKIALREGGSVELSDSGIEKWRLEHGQLVLANHAGKVMHVLKGQEIQNCSIYAVGEDRWSGGNNRTCMWASQSMPKDRFGVCVSSHKVYYEKTADRVLRSLQPHVDMASVVLVIGGCDEDEVGTSTHAVYGCQVVQTQQDCMGFTGLMALDLPSKYNYWLLLHDTCEVTDKFSEKLIHVDCALWFDAILIQCPSKGMEMGFWYQDYLIEARKGLESLSPDRMLDSLLGRAKMVTTVGGLLSQGVSTGDQKDVYGGGTRRRVLEYRDLGIKKFQGVSGTTSA